MYVGYTGLPVGLHGEGNRHKSFARIVKRVDPALSSLHLTFSQEERIYGYQKKRKRIDDAQEILNWAIIHLSGTIVCKVIDYKNENYRVQFFTKRTS